MLYLAGLITPAVLSVLAIVEVSQVYGGCRGFWRSCWQWVVAMIGAYFIGGYALFLAASALGFSAQVLGKPPPPIFAPVVGGITLALVLRVSGPYGKKQGHGGSLNAEAMSIFLERMYHRMLGHLSEDRCAALVLKGLSSVYQIDELSTFAEGRMDRMGAAKASEWKRFVAGAQHARLRGPKNRLEATVRGLVLHDLEGAKDLAGRKAREIIAARAF